MRRLFFRGLGVALTLVFLHTVAPGQPSGVADRILVRDGKKAGTTKTYEGTLVLDKAGLRVLSGDKVIATLDPADVLKITVGDLPGVDRNTMLVLFASEDKKTKKEYEAARLGYSDLLKKSAAAPERSRRHLEYKVAAMTAKLADETPDDEGWAALADTAIKTWDQFLAQHRSGWEAWMAALAYTRLLIETNAYDRAASTWTTLSKSTELPPNLLQEAALQAIDAQIRGGKATAAAEEAARNLAKDVLPGPIKDKLAIYELTAKALNSGNPLSGLKELEEKIAATKDASVRALGHAMRGELYWQAKKYREAMWEYLWVETVYNNDPLEVLKALSRLVAVFKALADDDQARRYREKILRLRSVF
jgi:hypothetical protein